MSLPNIRLQFNFVIISISANLLAELYVIRAAKLASSYVSSKHFFLVSLQQVTTVRNQNVTANCHKHFCGGSLLNSRWILSAAHCLWQRNMENIVITIAHEAEDMNGTGLSFDIERIEYFNFIPSNMRNDIALIRLRHSVCGKVDCSKELAQFMYARVPSLGMKASRKQPCKIIGYGVDQQASLRTRIQESDVYPISNKICSLLMGYMWSPRKGDNTICALGRLFNACVGDSGGPLLCDYNGASYIFGITSYGSICNSRNTVSVYTMTGPYSEWIQRTIVQ